MPQVCTGPRGIIKVTDPSGKIWTIGRMRNISVNASYGRQPVVGVGHVNPQELPVTSFNGSLSCDSYLMTSNTAIMKAFDFTVQDETKFWRFLLYERGISVSITQEAKVNGEYIEIPVCQVDQAFISGESWSMGEGSLWGHSGQFQLLTAPRVLASSIPESEIAQ